MSTKYVRNEDGGVHSVTEEHFENVLKEKSEGGRWFLKYGWEEISEDEARRENPQLFGTPDRAITYTSKELKEVRERREWDRELAEEMAAAAVEPDEEPEPVAAKSK